MLSINNHRGTKPLLIWDLDETLVFATRAALPQAPGFYCGPYAVHIRPGLAALLNTCVMHFEMAVWTSSAEEYAAGLVEHLFAAYPLAFIWARERCTRRRDMETHEVYWVKDLKKVKRRGYDLDRVLMVDDTPAKLQRSYGNLLRVTPFEGDPTDKELEALRPYLVWLAQQPNFRQIEKRGWASQRLE